MTPLMYASWLNRVAIINILLSYSANINDETSLFIATINNNIEVVNILLSKDGIDPNIPNKNGDTPLIVASQYGHLQIIESSDNIVTQTGLMECIDFDKNMIIFIIKKFEEYDKYVKLKQLRKQTIHNIEDTLKQEDKFYYNWTKNANRTDCLVAQQKIQQSSLKYYPIESACSMKWQNIFLKLSKVTGDNDRYTEQLCLLKDDNDIPYSIKLLVVTEIMLTIK